MNIYIWRRIEHATTNYHSAGGVVVIAETESEARIYFDSYLKKTETEKDYIFKVGIRTDEEPDFVAEIKSVEEGKVWIMPDAGCC